jgi:hypothetical protein
VPKHRANIIYNRFLSILCLHHRWVVAPCFGRLLECVRQLQHAHLILVPSYNLDAYRKALWREAAGDGYGG